MMPFIYKTVVVFLLLLSTALHSQNKALRLASDVWPPFTNLETEQSIAFDIVGEALRRIGIQPDFRIVEFGGVISGITDGSYDGSAALWKSAEREQSLIFSDAYLQNQLILVGRKGSYIGAKSTGELPGARIGVVEGYAYGDLTSAQDSIEVTYGQSDQQNLERLLSQKVDYILVDAILIQYLLKYQVNDVSELLEIGAAPLVTKSLHLAISKDIPGVQEIISRFNEEIRKMITDGSYNEILALDWISADVDGDGKVELVLSGDQAGKEAPGQVYSIYHVGMPKETNRYYIDGQIYDGWNNIPERYKKEAMQGTGPDPNKVGFKL